MEEPATAPATSNAIRRAEQSGNIAKQQLLGWWKRLEDVSWHNEMLDKQVVGSAT